MKWLDKFGKRVKVAFYLFSFGAIFSVATVLFVVVRYSIGLPSYEYLQYHTPGTTTRLYAADGQMIAEYAKEKRVFVPITAIPKKVVGAFISAEDQNFYEHHGVDFVAIARALVQNIVNIGSDRGLVGGSTITQQVVKNFLLTNERSIERKVKEAILSFRISNYLSKDRIMELYLNKIYLGNRSYGVATAAMNYFNKSVSELRLDEAALLAALPKAPSDLDPRRYPEKALHRRNWVIDRMVEEGYATEAQAKVAKAIPITIRERKNVEMVNSGFFADTVRAQVVEQYGEERVLEGGFAVHTTLRPDYQLFAEKALKKGLIAYDRRHGWRGPIAQIEWQDDWHTPLSKVNVSPAKGDWNIAVVLGVNAQRAHIGMLDKSEGIITVSGLKWARKFISRNAVGPAIRAATDVLKKGDVVLVSLADEKKKHYALEQIPDVNGSIVAMDPYTGRVLAMVGGYYYGDSQFNRAIQAKRQPGSVFKPFVYLSALENGFAPNSVVIDEAIDFYQGQGQPIWRPQNHSGKYYGPTPLRIGLEKSRNTMTVRLAEQLGIDHVMEVARRFGFNQEPQRNFAMVLGAAESNLLAVTNAYAMLANGGRRVEPYLIERIQNNNGATLYRHDKRECIACDLMADAGVEQNALPVLPVVVDNKERMADPVAVYQVTSMLEGVIQRGTGTKAKRLGRYLAGKTGTTNKSVDAWFLGYSSDLVVGVYVGFDQPKSLGRREFGSSAALPIWIDFMEEALKDRPNLPFSRPDGIKLVRIDSKSGQLPSVTTPKEDIIFEAFRAGTEPGVVSNIYVSPTLNGKNTGEEGGLDDDFGGGGIY